MASFPRPHERKLVCERLEDRRLLAVVTVDTVDDVVDFSDGVTSLREAIFATNTVPGADEINFDFGFDGPATILLTQGELQITDSLTINGPGAELLTIDASGNDPTPDLVDRRGSVVFEISDEIARNPRYQSIISDLTLTGGDSFLGGAIRTFEELTLSGVVIEENSGFMGGGIYVGEGSVDLRDSTIRSNNAVNGGGIFSESSSVAVDSSLVIDNRASFGGAIRVESGSALIVDSTVIRANHASAGGALSIAFRNNVTIISSTVEENESLGSGGGIYAIGGDNNAPELRILGTTFRGNTANTSTLFPNGGGGMYLSGGTALVSDSLFVHNSTQSHGGAISFTGGGLDILNSTFSGNSAWGFGGGIRSGGSLRMAHSTITDNLADSNANESGIGGGVSSRGVGQFSNVIMQGNRAGSEQGDYDLYTWFGSSNTIANSLIGTANNPGTRNRRWEADQATLFGVDARLATLADNGGPTLTHALLPGSPAINVGDLNAIAGENGVPKFDQRGVGFDRVVSRIDIGAYEVQELGDLNLLVDTLEDESDGDFSRGDLSLREAIELSNANPVQDTIEFDPTLKGGTILLTEGELRITDSLTINGPGAELLTIDASGNDPTPDSTYEDGDDTNDGDGSRVFYISDESSGNKIAVVLDSLTLTGGDPLSDGGGAVYVANGALSIIDSTVTGNSAIEGGGAYALFSHLLVDNSTISNNTSRNRSGGIRTFAGIATITNSLVMENSARGNGGGITSVGGSITIEDSDISNNTAGAGGAGIWASGELFARRVNVADNQVTLVRPGGGGVHLGSSSSAVIADSTITGNSATLAGGGVYTRSGYFDVLRSSISNNRAAYGGGIAARGMIEIMESELIGNTAELDGGGVWGRATINSSVVFGNMAGGNGGGVFAQNGTNVVMSAISRNSAGVDGGGIYLENHSEISDSIITDNEAVRNGGGLFAGTQITIFENSIYGNTAGENGGGVYLYLRNSVGNSTISSNSAGTNGGGIFSNTSNTLSHSTIAYNTAGTDSSLNGSGGGIYVGNSDSTLDHSIISGNIDYSDTAPDVAGIINSNRSLIGLGAEFLGPLQDNGGLTPTHALLPGSPAIDAGDSTLVAGENGVPAFDQRGNPYQRIFGARIDIGAYEVQSIPSDFDDDGDADADDLAMWTSGYGSATGGSNFLNWQRTFGDGVTTSEASSSTAEPAIADSDAVDFVLASEYLNNTTSKAVRGPVARRNAYAQPVDDFRAALASIAGPSQPYRTVSASTTEHGSPDVASDALTLDYALDALFPVN